MTEEARVVVTPSLEEFRSWYTPLQARERAAAHVGEQYAAEAVWKRIRAHQIRVAAQAMTTRRGIAPAMPEKHPSLIHANAWHLHQGKPDGLWTGDVEFAYDDKTEEIDPYTQSPMTVMVYVEAFGLRLNPQDVDEHFPQAATTNGRPATSTRHPGGPKPKPWWEDFWVAVGAHIYAGDIQPNTRQADVARLMMAWADTRGYEMSESTAKAMAKKLLLGLPK